MAPMLPSMNGITVCDGLLLIQVSLNNKCMLIGGLASTTFNTGLFGGFQAYNVAADMKWIFPKLDEVDYPELITVSQSQLLK
jgi:hypothetical protein